MRFDAQGHLTAETLDELFLADSDEKLKMLCIAMAQKGFPTVPVDENNEPIQGIVIEKQEKPTEKK